MNAFTPNSPSIPSRSLSQDELYGAANASFGSALERLAAGYEANRERRRDLLQEIHLALWRSFTTYAGQCSLRTWTYRVAHNVAINHVVRDKRENNARLVSIDELFENTHADSRVDSTDAVDMDNTLSELTAMIHRLKMPDRQIMLLYLDDADGATIAQVTGMSLRNVATKIHRIKNMLARRFSGVAP